MKPTANLKNIFSLFSVDIFTKLLGFFTTTYLARILGTSGFGAISIGLAALVYVQILSSSGLTLMGTKRVAEGIEETGYLTGDIVSVRLILTTIVIVLAYFLSYFFISSEEIRLIVLIYILYGFPSAVLLDWFFTGKQRMEITSAGRVVNSVVYLIFVFLLVKSSDDIVNTAVAWVIAGMANSIFIWIIFKKYKYKIIFKLKRLKTSFSLLKQSFPIGFASLLSQAVIMFPAIYLGFAAGTSEAGIYSAAYRLITLFLIFDRVFATVFFPKIVNAISQAPGRLEEIFNRILKIISLLALAVSVPMIVAGDFMIHFVFGEAFKESILVFQLLTGFFAFTLINSVLSYTLIATNREGIYIFSLTISVVTFIAAILFFYNEFLTPGIAIALLIYEIVQASIMIFRFRKAIHIKYLTSIITPVLVSLIIIFLLVSFDVHFIIKTSAAIIVGTPLIALASGLTIEDIKYIKRLMI